MTTQDKRALRAVKRLKHVERWTGHLVLNRLNVLEHTAEVTFVCRQLCVCLNLDRATCASVYEYAIIHDLGESFTGDIPHTIKNNTPGLKEALRVAEESALFSLGIVSDPSLLVKTIVKCADCITCVIEAQDELKLGNNHSGVTGAYGKLCKVLESLRIKESETVEDKTQMQTRELINRAVDYSLNYIGAK